MAERAVPDEILQFNAYLVEQQQAEQQSRRVRKAEAAKQQAAERVRQVMADPDSSREARAEAEAAYHEALEVHRAVAAGEPLHAGEPAGGDGDDRAEGPHVGSDDPVEATAAEADVAPAVDGEADPMPDGEASPAPTPAGDDADGADPGSDPGT